MRAHILWLVGAFLIVGAVATAQETWIPVTAKLRETYQTFDKGGRQVSCEVKEGNYYRNSEGSTLEYWVTVNGDESRGGSGELVDNRTWTEYALNLRTRVAVKKRQMEAAERLKPDFLAGARTSKLGQESIEGIVCYLTRVTLTGPDGHSQPVGTACQSPDYGITLKTDMTIVSPQDGTAYRTLRELHDIRIGETPDSKLFQIPADFQLLKPE